VTTVLDAGTYREGVDELLPLIDHLVVSEKFALSATGKKSPADALKPLAAYGAEAVTITSGKQGSVSRSANEMFYHPAFDVEVVDTTGCGDVFHGGYIFGLLRGWSLQQRVRFASACAALKARCMGGRTAIPVLEQVEEFLERHK
jgi:ribokinase